MKGSTQKKNNKAIRVLLLDDGDRDAELVIHHLARTGQRFQTRRVASRTAFADALGTFEPDVVLSDHGMHGFDGLAALDLVRATRPGTPFIVVSSAIDEATAVACVKAGADDILLKSNLRRIATSISSAIDARRRLRALSPRQLQVLQLVAQGHTTREVARKLRVGIKTAETHRAEVMRRLGVHDVVGLVRIALRTGVASL